MRRHASQASKKSGRFRDHGNCTRQRKRQPAPACKHPIQLGALLVGNQPRATSARRQPAKPPGKHPAPNEPCCSRSGTRRSAQLFARPNEHDRRRHGKDRICGQTANNEHRPLSTAQWPALERCHKPLDAATQQRKRHQNQGEHYAPKPQPPARRRSRLRPVRCFPM